MGNKGSHKKTYPMYFIDKEGNQGRTNTTKVTTTQELVTKCVEKQESQQSSTIQRENPRVGESGISTRSS